MVEYSIKFSREDDRRRIEELQKVFPDLTRAEIIRKVIDFYVLHSPLFKMKRS